MNLRLLPSLAVTLGLLAATSQAAFHVMQIEQVLGSVNGNTNVQAIQLRMRSAGQGVIGNGRLVAYDANGANPVILLDPTTSVGINTAGSNVLFTSAAFNSLMTAVPGYASDFTLASTIPSSYFAGGKVTWESNAGVVQWALAFGAYIGTNTGLASNTTGASGNFGAPFAGALPTLGTQAIRFTGAASALSTANSSDYAFSSPATVRNNAGASFAVVPEPGTAALLVAFGLGAVAFARRRLT